MHLKYLSNTYSIGQKICIMKGIVIDIFYIWVFMFFCLSKSPWIENVNKLQNEYPYA